MAAVLMLANVCLAQSTVVYREGPLSLNGSTQTEFDLNQDGIADFWFYAGSLAGLPSPGSPSTSTPYLDTFAFNRNDYLMNSEGRIVLKQAGVTMGPETAPGESWEHRDFEAQSVAYAFGNTWPGFSEEPPEAFLGVRFLSAGSTHYGWIRFVISGSNYGPRPVLLPVIAEWAYESRPNTAIRAGAGADSDHDGVWDSLDQCHGTPMGAVVDTNGCSIAQLAPCDRPWRNHGEYVKAVEQAASRFVQARLITEANRATVMNQAAASDCGKSK